MQNSSVHPNDEDQEAHWLQNSQCKDAVEEYDELGQLSLVTICVHNDFASSCITLHHL